MFKRHCIALISLLILIVGSQTVPAQQQISLDTYAIFQQSCLICHGPNGAYKETLLMEHDALIKEGTVIPGNPDASLLYDRVLGTPGSGPQMPLGQPPLSPQAINTIRNWILAGAPDWTATSTTNSDFISPAEILNTIETHLMSLAPFDRAYARYFTMTHLYNAGGACGDTPRIPKRTLQTNQQPLMGEHHHQPATHRPHKGPSSTSTYETTSGMSITGGDR